MTDAQAASAGASLRLAVARSAWSFVPAGTGWSNSASCFSMSGTDVDADGFPETSVPGNVTLSSCQRPAFGANYQASGTYTLDDMDSGAIAGLGHGANGTLSLGGATLTFAQTGFIGQNVIETLGEVTYPFSSTPGDLQYEAFDYGAGYSPLDGSWQVGTTLEHGYFGFGGEAGWQFTDGERDVDVHSSLIVQNAEDCPTLVTNGSAEAFYRITGDYDPCSDSSIETWQVSVHWTSCDVTSIEHTQYFPETD